MDHLYFAEQIVFWLFFFNVCYLFLFSISSKIKTIDPPSSSEDPNMILILIPAYKEDLVIFDTVDACLHQAYPKNSFETVVISDQMQDNTIKQLQNKGVRVECVSWENSSKAKSLNYALSKIEGYNIVLVLDADNIIEPLFLQKINGAFHAGYNIIQAHRTAKNLNTSFAVLDAISEEINNSIFRKGHCNLGLSSALIGSGMAFNFQLYKRWMSQIQSVSGEDKELEFICLKEGYRVHYLNDAIVLDEKTQQSNVFLNQRKRWIAVQVENFCRFVPHLCCEVKNGNIHFCDKVFQGILPPRILLLGITFMFSVIISFISHELSIKWWMLFGCLVLSLIISVPISLYTLSTFRALLKLPMAFCLVFFSLFKLRGAKSKFIHTPHGID